MTRSRGRAQNESMRITMVKKRLAGGRTCEKCEQAEELLRSRGLWARIDEVAWAVEGEPDSPGMLLSKRHAVEVAPFFVVTGDDGADTVYTSALKLIRDLFPEKRGAVRAEAVSPAELEELAARMADSPPETILRWGLERYGRCAASRSAAPRTSCWSTWRPKSSGRSACSRSTPAGCTPRPTASSTRCASTTRSRSRRSSRSRKRSQKLVREKGLF